MIEKQTLAEGIAFCKQLETQLLREMDSRTKIMNGSYRNKEKLSDEENAEKEIKFNEIRETHVGASSQTIEDMKSRVLDLKKKINSKNIEIGQDLNLQKIKWIRIELQRLMNVHGGISSLSLYDESTTYDTSIMINDLEVKKIQLDNLIQKKNHETIL